MRGKSWRSFFSDSARKTENGYILRVDELMEYLEHVAMNRLALSVADQKQMDAHWAQFKNHHMFAKERRDRHIHEARFVRGIINEWHEAKKDA